MIGEILGNRYKILRDLGNGGMAWVYLAEDSVEKETVALKVLYPQFSLDMAYLQRFVREAKVASALTSPHIVKVLDYGATRDIHYLVMEYIDGQNIKDVLAVRNHFSWQEALKIARQVGLALDHAFQFGIVHRDIKPQNLMIAEDGLVKVLDFGIARALTMPSLTVTGFVGSPYYISPEQAKGERVDIRSDIYSLGIVLFEMLTGKVPFNADNPWAIISQHISDDPPPLSKNEAEIPNEVSDLTLTALAKQRENRFQTPQQMIAAIDTILAGKDAPETKKSIPDLNTSLEQTFQRGIKAAQSEQWVQAFNLFSYVADLSPDFENIQDQLTTAETQVRLQELYDSALNEIKNKHWKEARLILMGIRKLDAHYKDVSNLLAELNATLGQNTTENDAPTPPMPKEQPLSKASSLEGARHKKEKNPSSVADSKAISSIPESITTYEEDLSSSVILSSQASRRWLLGILITILIAGALIVGGIELTNRQRQQSVRTRYDRAISLYQQGNWEEAIKELDRILVIDPNYEEAVSIKAEAVRSRELAKLFNEGKAAYEAGNLAEAITFLSQLRSQDLTFEQSSVVSMLCDAYYNQAIDLSQNIDIKSLQSAITLLDKALEICPTDTEILSEKKTLETYLQAMIDLGEERWNQVFEKLGVLEQIDPDLADLRVNKILYQAYFNFGERRQSEGNLSAALLHFQKALSIPGVDHEPAQKKVKELEDKIAATTTTPAPTTMPTSTQLPEPSQEPTSQPTVVSTITPQQTFTPTTTTATRYYRAPELVSPPDGTIFTSGKFEKIILEWEGPEELAEDEYYDVTILHFFNEEEVYWGTNTQEKKIELLPDIGYGQADKDIFHWFVTLRRAERVDNEGKPDGPPISLRSDAWTFFWR